MVKAIGPSTMHGSSVNAKPTSNTGKALGVVTPKPAQPRTELSSQR